MENATCRSFNLRSPAGRDGINQKDLSNQNNSEIMITIMMIIKIEGEEGEEKEVGHIVLEK